MKSDSLILVAMMGVAGWLVLKGTQAKNGTTGSTGILGSITSALGMSSGSSNGLLPHQFNVMDLYNPNATGNGQTIPLADLYSQVQGFNVNTEIMPTAGLGSKWI